MRHHSFFLAITFLSSVTAVAQNWPSFRGPNASGVADGQDLPLEWSAPESINILWKTAIPGLAHSSPIVWRDRVYVTAAVSSAGTAELRTGDSQSAGYTAVDDVVPHRWLLYSLDRRTGIVHWQKTVHEGVPEVRRHPKASHASATPATDGKHIVVLMGSEGLFCFDTDGNLLWQKDVGLLDVGLWEGEGPEYQWGPASSPIIRDNLVFVQNDRQRDSFLAAYRLDNGEEVWKAARDEKPAWSTPALYEGTRPELITNGANYIRAYDPMTGRELWRMSNQDSQVIIPTPVVRGDLVVVTGSYPTGAKPVYVVRPGGEGDISLTEGETTNEHVVWMAERGSPYTPTPLVYRGIVYTSVDNGILNAYDLESGDRLYRVRIAVGAGFSASPIASDGKIYFTSEDGVVYVVKAGADYELLAENDMGEVLMATPAISHGMLIVRGRDHVFGVGADAGDD